MAMELQPDAPSKGSLDKDGGFTMDFSIDVVEDVPSLVDAMMSLGARGYFQEARELSDHILLPHHSIFAVAAECMRLLLDQGDFEGLRTMAQTIDRTGWNVTQSQVVDLMEAISCICLAQPITPGIVSNHLIESSIQELWHWGSIGSSDADGSGDNDHAAEMLLLSTLRIRLFYLSSAEGFKRSPLLLLTDYQHQRLVDLVLLLIRNRHFWSADTVIELCCHPTGASTSVPMQDWPNSRVEYLSTALDEINTNTSEGRLSLLALSQTMCETLARMRYYDNDYQTFPTSIASRIRHELKRQARLVNSGEYNPRCHLRYTLIALEERAVKSFEQDGLPIMESDLDQLDRVQVEAQANNDNGLYQLARSRCITKSEKRNYCIFPYSSTANERTSAHVRMQPIRWRDHWLLDQLDQPKADAVIPAGLHGPDMVPAVPSLPISQNQLENGIQQVPADASIVSTRALDSTPEKSLDTAGSPIPVSEPPVKSFASIFSESMKGVGPPSLESDDKDQRKPPLKLEILYLRLSRWRENVEILVEPDKADAHMAKLLLGEITETLNQAYGILQRHEPQGQPIMPNSRMRFGRRNSISQKARWSLRDQGKLDKLMDNLDTHITQLESLVPDAKSQKDSHELQRLKDENLKMQGMLEEFRKVYQTADTQAAVDAAPAVKALPWHGDNSNNIDAVMSQPESATRELHSARRESMQPPQRELQHPAPARELQHQASARELQHPGSRDLQPVQTPQRPQIKPIQPQGSHYTPQQTSIAYRHPRATDIVNLYQQAYQRSYAQYQESYAQSYQKSLYGRGDQRGGYNNGGGFPTSAGMHSEAGGYGSRARSVPPGADGIPTVQSLHGRSGSQYQYQQKSQAPRNYNQGRRLHPKDERILRQLEKMDRGWGFA